MAPSQGIEPGTPFPSFAPTQCALFGCSERSEHRGALQARLLGGHPYEPAEVVIEVDLCHVHAATSHGGLEVGELIHSHSSPAPSELCAVRDCNNDADHLPALPGRLLGGYQYPAVDAVLALPLCYEHDGSSREGLQRRGFTAPTLG